MREIKFRAWIPLAGHTNEYPKVGSMYHWKLNFQSHGGEQGIRYGTVMQFTGMVDKNGKDIYEGDIVTQSFGAKPTVVEWGFYAADDHEKAIGYQDVSKQKVIGNIYEHKVEDLSGEHPTSQGTSQADNGKAVL